MVPALPRRVVESWEMERLSKAKIEAYLKTPPAKLARYGDSEGPCLYLAVTPAGSASWIQRLTIGSRRTDIGLGGWPLINVDGARAAAMANRLLVFQGGDPREAKRQAQTVPTVEEIAERCTELRGGKGRSTSIRSAALRRHVYPLIGKLKINAVTRRDVIRVLTPLPAATRHKVRSYLRTTFEAALAEEWITLNPCDGIGAALPKTVKAEHRASVPYQQVPAALRAIEASTASAVVKGCLRFVVLTGCRSGEARQATPAEFDLDAQEWRIPAAHTKTDEARRVPLPDAVCSIVQGRQSALVWPTASGGLMSDVTLQRALRRCVAAASVHGFRSSYRTFAEEKTDADHAVMEMSIGHVQNSVLRAYARGELMEKRRKLACQWADHCISGEV